jgi:sugar phosphate isomerase/epimerase
MTNPMISVQLYSLRKLGDLDTQLDAVAAAGYTSVELIQGQLEDVETTKAKLAARGLAASSAHVGMAGLRSQYQRLLDNAKTLGLHHIIMPAFAPEERGGGAQHWADRGRELGVLARRLRSQGVRLGYHNHNWEFAPLADGSLPIRHLFANSGDSLFCELDVAWVVRGGADPSEWLRAFKGKLLAVHVKDLAPAGQNLDEGGWASVGAGTVDWKRLWGESLQAGAQQMVVEHDNPKDPAASIKQSHDYIVSTLAS